ncbi:MAG: CRTAC1 family protein, partial [Flavobacteriaceae bacterium]|nr:CRTAC1 family protein [Flavobacteriaceae bacterium]
MNTKYHIVRSFFLPLLQTVVVLFMSILIFSCSSERDSARFTFKNAKDTGIDFQNNIISTPQFNILNYIYFYNGAGVASGDFNNDGNLDLYFTANMEADKLYLNKGDFKFEDISGNSGIENSDPWTTGVTVADVNNDGLLDVYICKLGSYKEVIEGHNLLYVNQGNDENGTPKFLEKSADYGLDFKGFSTQATFFDYDLDGDLDMFLLNHSVNPNQNYGKGSQRFIPNKESGDKLFENKEGVFVDISEEAGIIQSKFGYGLGVSISDLNNDGYPDIYVGNDFFENDYLYINQGDKTFKEVITTQPNLLGHTTHYSMGNDIADLNNDGYTDIVSVDMLPEDLTTYKSSGTEFNYQIYNNYLNNGYSRQYMQNTLHRNNGNGSFSEIAYQAGIAATEWSWSPLIADFDNDGLNDLYITNGILGATNDMDFINFIANEEIQRSLNEGMDTKDMAFIDKIPEKKTTNYFFRNNTHLQFEDVSEEWLDNTPSFSNGSSYADLDNDGDLDLVTNNVNEKAYIIENRSNITDSLNWLRIRFKGTRDNVNGIGTKVILYREGEKMIKENFTTRGYLSAVAPELHFGLGTTTFTDSLKIIWPDKTFETLFGVESNKLLEVNQENAEGNYYTSISVENNSLLENVNALLDFTHKENPTIDFNRNPLLAFAQ